MYKTILCMSLFFLSMTPLILAERIILKDGQVIDGTIIEEQDTFLRIKSGFDSIQVDRNQVLSIQRTPQSDEDKSGGTVPEENMDDATKLSNLQYYRETVAMLNEQVNVQKATISLLQEQLKELQQKSLKNEASFQNKIKKLEQELEKKNSAPTESHFKELMVIQPNKEVTIDKGYLKKVKFRVSEGIDGYFVGAEYTLMSEFVRIEPNFVTYFFDERGLNIGTDVNSMKFNVIPRGHEEVITKGVPMMMPDARPYYFYIKINTDTEDQI